jgi:superoxide dismutase, Cu-Zn family
MLKKIALVTFLAACGGGSKQAATETAATATTAAEVGKEVAAGKPIAGGALEPRSGSAVTGAVEVMPMGDGVHVTVRVANATPGKHGLHFHEKGDCSAPDASSAGGHWNPDGVTHGAPDKDPHHAGDLGNIEIGSDGTGTASAHLKGYTATAGDRSVIGKALILHEKEDDLTTQPTGNAGGRIACAVIVEAP